MILRGKRLIVVLGMHRSGTSMITRALEVLGAALGDRLMPPVDGNNAKGFFEDIDLNALNIEILQALGSEWHCLAPIEPADVESLHKKGFFLRAVALLRQKTANTTIFGFKDPRVAKLLPFWRQVFAHCEFDTGYVLAIRNPLSVAQSLAKRDGICGEKSYMLWLGHVLTSLVHTEETRRVLIDYDHFLDSPQEDLGLIAKRLVLEIDPQAFRQFQSEFLDKELRHTVYAVNDLAEDQACPPLVKELYAALHDVSRNIKLIDNPEFHKRTAYWSDEFNRLKSNLKWLDRLSAEIANLNQSINVEDREITEIIRATLEQDQNIFRNTFDADWYQRKYPDVANAGVDPYQHYIHHGVSEGRLPSDGRASFVRHGLLDRLKELNAQNNHAKLLTEALQLQVVEREQQRDEQSRQNAEREQTHLAQLAQARQQIETHLLDLAERERAFSRQLQEIQQVHEQQRSEQSRQNAEREQTHLAQLAQARQQIEAHLLDLAEREKAFSRQLQEIQQVHEQQRSEQGRQNAEREQTYLAQLAQARQQIETHLLDLAEREKAFSRQLHEIQQAHEQQRSDQGRQFAEREQALARLQREFDAMHATYSWRLTAPLRSLATLLRHKDSGDFKSVTSTTSVERANGSSAKRTTTETEILDMYASQTDAAATPLDELLSYENEHFISSAYQTLLGRAPDSEGLSYYLARLRKGIDKIEILAQLRLSSEGKSRIYKMAGLDAAIRRHELLRLPLLGTLLHFVGVRQKQWIKRSGSRAVEGARCAQAAQVEQPLTEISNDLQVINDSGLFDENYYLSNYTGVLRAGLSAAEHFCLYGWKESRNPRSDFSAKYYLRANPDVRDANINPFVHWLRHGKGEGRKINLVEVDICRNEDTVNTPSVIFISHEASRTGAPAVLLSLMRWIKNNTNINFSIVIGAQGPWNSKFEELAPCYYMDSYHPDGLLNGLRHFCGNHVQIVYVNTIAAGLYAKHLNFLNAEYITHVHEMENVFKIFEPHFDALKQLCKKFIAVSPGSVDAIKKRTDKKTTEIIFLKPFIEPKQEISTTVNRLTNKKIIFGCGAVESRKGFDLFCDVGVELLRKNFTNFKMYWIGAIGAASQMDPKDEINRRNLGGYVEWLGVKDYPIEYFEGGDVFLSPSREDPYPLVCLEAAQCAMPVICFDEKAGGMHTFVEDDAGFVVPYLNVNEMAKATLRLLNDENLSAHLGRRASSKVKERHLVDVIAPQILQHLPKIINSKSSTELDSYKELIDGADIVSFDIFDTLVTRRLSNPNVVFDVIEYKYTQKDCCVTPFFQERMSTAGKVLNSYGGKIDDISIDEIYNSMPFYKNSKFEKETEIQMCIPHDLGIKLYNYALKSGKKVFIASDMYLDQDTIEKILQKCGVNQWNELLLSSAIGLKKDTGKLFPHLVDVAAKYKIPTNRILHIGDNWKGDIQKAKEANLNAVRFIPIYEKSHNIFGLKNDRQSNLSQIGRIWDSFCIQATKLWHESHPGLANDFFTKLGFELTGPLAAMMAMFVKKEAEHFGANKIVFMARDGRIIKKAFDTLYSQEIKQGEFDSVYLSLSRATVIPATFENPLSANDIYFLTEGLHFGRQTLGYYLEKANLGRHDNKVVGIVKKYFKSLDVVPVWEDLNRLSSMFSDLSNMIHEVNSNARKALKRYLQQNHLLTEDRIILVDVGWLLNIQSRLDRFIKSIGSRTLISGCYVGSRDRINKSLSHSSLLFELGDPYEYANFIEGNTTLFEILFSAPEASASGLFFDEKTADAAVKYKQLPTPPTKEFYVAQKIQMGAVSFLGYFKEARDDFFPEQISKDYFFYLFEALVKTDNDLAKAELINFEVRLGGHHDIVAHEALIQNDTYFEYALKKKEEYFDPMEVAAAESNDKILIITSAGLDNGSTRYRALNLMQALKYRNISSVLLHSATPLEDAGKLIEESSVIIFQRCFEEQGNVGEFLKIAREKNKKCIAEIDDLIFPEHIAIIGSVAGGEWNEKEAMFVASSYEKLIRKMDACIVSTPPLRQYIEQYFSLPTEIFRNKVEPKFIGANSIRTDRLRLIYASGTYSHKEDFSILEDVLFNFLVQHPSVTLSILGAAQVTARILGLPNVNNYPLLDYVSMLELISQHDLMLVPLENNIFNESKSSVKYVECGAVGVPVLASRIGEYEFAVEHLQNGLLASSKQEWRELLNLVSKDPHLLNKLSKNAQRDVAEGYSTLHMEDGLLNFLRTIFDEQK